MMRDNRGLFAWMLTLVLIFAVMGIGNIAWPQADNEASDDEEKPVVEDALETGRVDMNFESPVAVSALIDYVQKSTGARFLYDPAVVGNKKVWLKAPNLPVEAVFPVFEHVLENQGLMLVKVGEPDAELYRLLPISKTGQPFPFLDTDEMHRSPGRAQIVTQVYQLRHADPTKVQQAIRQLMTPTVGKQFPVQELGLLILQDYSVILKTVEKIIVAIDLPEPDREIEVIPINYALAEEIAQQLTQLLEISGALTTTSVTPISRPTRPSRRGAPPSPPAQAFKTTVAAPPTILADKRTNSLILVAMPSELEEIYLLVERLDVPVPPPPTTIHVFRLRNTKADDMAATLNDVFSTGVRSLGQSSKVEGGKSTQPRAAINLPGVPRANGEEEPFSIVSEVNLNALIVQASPQAFPEVERIIKLLDVRRPQVLIEAAIVELSPQRATQFGIELAASSGNAESAFAGQTSTGISSITDLFEARRDPVIGTIASPTGMVLALLNNRAEVPILIQALATDTDVDILSTPRLVVNDNEEAEITISDEVPVTTFTTTESTTDVTSFGGYEQAAITLKIKPYISQEGRYLRLDIDQLVEDFVGTVAAGSSVPPPKTSRHIITHITVPDRRTIIIGGLTQDSEEKTVRGVPWLMDIPVIGWAFKNESIQKVKKVLYIFVTPHILSDEGFDDVDQVTKAVIDKVEEGGSRKILDGIAQAIQEARDVHQEDKQDAEDKEKDTDWLNKLDSLEDNDKKDTLPGSDESRDTPLEPVDIEGIKDLINPDSDNTFKKTD